MEANNVSHAEHKSRQRITSVRIDEAARVASSPFLGSVGSCSASYLHPAYPSPSETGRRERGRWHHPRHVGVARVPPLASRQHGARARAAPHAAHARAGGARGPRPLLLLCFTLRRRRPARCDVISHSPTPTLESRGTAAWWERNNGGRPGRQRGRPFCFGLVVGRLRLAAERGLLAPPCTRALLPRLPAGRKVARLWMTKWEWDGGGSGSSTGRHCAHRRVRVAFPATASDPADIFPPSMDGYLVSCRGTTWHVP